MKNNNKFCPPYPDCIEQYIDFEDQDLTDTDCYSCDDENVYDLWGTCYHVDYTFGLDLYNNELTGEIPQDIDTQDASGNTALMGVCFKGYDAIAKALIYHGANVNVKNYNGATALIYATMFKKINIIKLLIENGADKTIKDDSGKTALDHAIMHGMKEAIDLLQ